MLIKMSEDIAAMRMTEKIPERSKKQFGQSLRPHVLASYSPKGNVESFDENCQL